MRWLALSLMCLTLAACSKVENAPTEGGSDVADTAATSGSAGSVKDAVPVSLPKLSYSYALNYVLPPQAVVAQMEAHAAKCRALGPTRCQLFAMNQSELSDGYPTAMLQLRVATDIAQEFSGELDQDVTGAGGRVAKADVAAEDVSKDIIDAEARIHQRETLVGKLMDKLRARQGSTEDLKQAENDVTQMQTELEQSRAWLAELRGRVALSKFDIHYSATAAASDPGSLGAGLKEAAAGSGSLFLLGIGWLAGVAIYLGPWLLIAAPVLLWLRHRRRRHAAVNAG